MAKIDVAQIEGYENMTPEQKIAALEGFDMPEPGLQRLCEERCFRQDRF